MTRERIIANYSAAHGLRYAILRYFNACGADPNGETGDSHEPKLHVIPLALDAASGSEQLAVLGEDFPSPDGTCVRDCIHVTDIADAHVAALKSLLTGRPAEATLGWKAKRRHRHDRRDLLALGNSPWRVTRR